MTIRDSTHVTSAKPHPAAVQRQAPTPLMPCTNRSAHTELAIPDQSAIGPNSVTKITARPRLTLPAATPPPENISRPNLLSP
jgi:hypothetical protein